MLNRTMVWVIFFLLAAETLVCAGEWGPWSSSAIAPVITPRSERTRVAPLSAASRDETLIRVPFSLLLKLYKNYISPLDGDRCPMYPTCSQYCAQAINRHGLLIGIVLTSDRLLHEADERKFAPAVKVGSRYRILDSLHNNDFWWSQ